MPQIHVHAHVFVHIYVHVKVPFLAKNSIITSLEHPTLKLHMINNTFEVAIHCDIFLELFIFTNECESNVS